VGSVRLLVDSTGSVVERIDYDEFGNVLADTSVGSEPFGFGGGAKDADTGLTKLGARDLESVTGRWLTRDPILFKGGVNIYAYSTNDLERMEERLHSLR
jgi:RHS repeat-associated protein